MMAEYHLPMDHREELVVDLDNAQWQRVGKSHNEGGLRVALMIKTVIRKQELRALTGQLMAPFWK